MLNFNFSDFNVSEEEIASLSGRLNDIKNFSEPPFTAFKENINDVKKTAKNLLTFKNVVIIGNGGSTSGAFSFFGLAKTKNIKRKFYFLTTPDPLEIKRVKKACPDNNTLIIVISKSGETVNVIEESLQFKNYKKIIAITQIDTPLFNMATSLGWQTIVHPNIGGRFSARSIVGYIPAFLMGLNLAKLDQGFKDAYEENKVKKDIAENNALMLAADLYILEQKGYSEIYLPVYSSVFFESKTILTQLFHESVCKNEKGQTVLALDAPESQHHSNQRFFGGPKNMTGLFMVPTEDMTLKIKVPDKIKKISIRDDNLEKINNISYSQALMAEAAGSYDNAINKNIPVGKIEIEEIDEYSLGYAIGFFQMASVYSSWIRGNNAFDQPDVDNSKKISWEELTNNKI